MEFNYETEFTFPQIKVCIFSLQGRSHPPPRKVKGPCLPVAYSDQFWIVPQETARYPWLHRQPGQWFLSFPQLEAGEKRMTTKSLALTWSKN